MTISNSKRRPVPHSEPPSKTSPREIYASVGGSTVAPTNAPYLFTSLTVLRRITPATQPICCNGRRPKSSLSSPAASECHVNKFDELKQRLIDVCLQHHVIDSAVDERRQSIILFANKIFFKLCDWERACVDTDDLLNTHYELVWRKLWLTELICNI